MSHSPEPWYWKNDTLDRPYCFLMCLNDNVLSTAQDEEWSPSEEDAKRITACVNALKGVPTEELEEIITAGRAFIIAEFIKTNREVLR